MNLHRRCKDLCPGWPDALPDSEVGRALTTTAANTMTVGDHQEAGHG